MNDVRKPRRRWYYALELGAILAVLAALLLPMSAYETVNGGAGPKLFLVGRMAALIAICTWLLWRGGERWVDLGFRRPRRWWITPLLALCGSLALLIAVGVVRGTILPSIGVAAPEPSALAGIKGDLGQYLFYGFIVAWGSTAFGEELLLRGFILDRVLKLIGSTCVPAVLLGIIGQAALFGSLHFHQGLGGVILTGTFGLIMGLVWLLGGRNLWPCILIHGLTNFLSATEYYNATA